MFIRPPRKGLRQSIVALVAMSIVASACSDGPAATPQPTTTVERIALPAQSGGCSAATEVSAGDAPIEMRGDGVTRSYLRHVPSSYSQRTPMPVVIELHGYQSGAAVQTTLSALGAYGDEQGFITITPQGTAAPIPRWDASIASPDTVFLGDVLDDVEATLCVDPHRVFVTGLSNGAMMTSVVACVYADRVAAVAPVAGVHADIEGCAPNRAVPVIAFHGTADEYLRYDGGLGDRALALPGPDGTGTIADDPEVLLGRDGPSVQEQMQRWAQRNGCGTKPRETDVADDVTRIAYRCESGADVELYRIAGGGHSWPGSEFSRAGAALLGPTTFSINANELMWQFFTAHPIP